MIVNGAIGGLQSYSTGQSACSILCNTGAGIFAGYIGGAGPDWNDTNIFIPHQVREGYGYGLYKTLERARKSFMLVWRGLDSNKYITKQFGGILSGFIKGWALSNTISILSDDPEDFAKRIWEKYKPDWLKSKEEDEGSYGIQ